MNKHLTVSNEVSSALAGGKPVVALESTIIAHGMPYPANFEMAQDVEAIIREAGAVPATIAIIGGALKVGLTTAELKKFAVDGPGDHQGIDAGLALCRGAKSWMAPQRWLPPCALPPWPASMFLQRAASVACTAAPKSSFDISADMMEFAESNVAVVTAGAKAILDLALTLETLETLGVPVVGYGTDDFPAFYSRQSGHAVPMRCDTPQEVANLMEANGAWD